MKWVIPLFFLFSCWDLAYPSQFVPPNEDLSHLKDHADWLTNRLDRFLDGGQVVSREPHSTIPLFVGDSLLFTGIALAVSSCEGAYRHYEPLEVMLHTKGTFYRFHPLPEAYRDNPVSYDGIAGVFYGLSKKWAQCPEQRDRIEWIVHTFRDYVSTHKVFYEGFPAKYEFGFDYVPNLLASKFGLGPKPSQDAKQKMEYSANVWTMGVIWSEKECYRPHLATLNLLSMTYLQEEVSDGIVSAYCTITEDSSFYLGDYLCRRMTGNQYLQHHGLNSWNYELQRCKWEQRDGFGKEHPALDFLMMWDLATW